MSMCPGGCLHADVQSLQSSVVQHSEMMDMFYMQELQEVHGDVELNDTLIWVQMNFEIHAVFFTPCLLKIPVYALNNMLWPLYSCDVAGR